ncbi:Zn-ribbon domain-containing OB-fold protein [Phenylobacterium sp.]|jgi:uncharacterized OB-fold protein|uniref:Zn-ribbon domain-containing OB-fold protein n=1 Tax=Phenylobacterium sp. TaxID=1871053 RepID=UPI002F404D42
MSQPWRPIPKLDDDNRFFWTSGADGKLRFLHCDACDHYLHPPGPVCPKCLSADLAPKAVSGAATVRSVTVNHQPFAPGMAVPFAIAIVNIAEQDDVNLTTNIVDVAPDQVITGMPVQVTFEQHGEVYVPLFKPA